MVANAMELLARKGRHGDTELAHISRGERNLIRAWQGYEDINPHTGLPEYFSFKKALKGIAKAAGAVAGAYLGGPAGAAVGGALATKLTGGSWKSALGTGLLSGISAYGLQQSGFGDTLGIGALGAGTDLLGRAGTAAASGAAGAASGAASSGLNMKSLLPIAAVGIGALAGKPKSAKPVSTAVADQYTGPSWEDIKKPLDRKYEGAPDYYSYGQNDGEHEFFDEVNPVYASGGAVRRFKYGGDTREGGVTGQDRGRGAGMGGGKGSEKEDRSLASQLDKVKGMSGAGVGGYADPDLDRISKMGDPTTLEGLFSRVPGPLTGIGNIVNGTPTPQDYVQTGAQVLGAISGNPLIGQGVGLGIGMGNAVTDVQKLRDLGMLGGSTSTDDSMGRVDVVDGEAYSHGNPAADDRAPNSSGLGGGMTGGHGGVEGSSVLNQLTRTFTPPATAGNPTGTGGIGSVGTTPTPTTAGRKYQGAQDYYTYGQTTPEWQFFDQVNPVTTAATGGTIKGKGSGQSDEIPALLSDNEHVIDADVVAAIGDGSSDEGHRRIEAFKRKIRKEKRSAPIGTIPPKTKGLGSYFKGAA